MRIALGSDHRGYHAKEKLKLLLEQLGYEVEDFGTNSTKAYDYPDVAWPVATNVAQGKADRAILLCGTGLGVSISANKVPGIRAALCHDELTAQMSRQHNDANVLCLPADLIGEALTRRIVEVWLETPFEGGRHLRRVQKITEIEKAALGSASEPAAKPMEMIQDPDSSL
jgi:ribose 5-phosphate isomerase B